jgi:predicted DNA-binding protein with PD1-like motif
MEVSYMDIQKHHWEMDAKEPNEYHFCETTRGREFILRLTTGADPLLAIRQFAIDNDVRFGKVHAAFMGAFQPAVYDKWVPNVHDPHDWNQEVSATCSNLSMLLAAGGMISQRKKEDGEEETFVAMHFASGGAWDIGTFGGHLEEGTRVKGVMCVFVTELLDIEVQYQANLRHGYRYPENFYVSTKK